MSVSLTVVVVIDDACMGSSNVAVTAVPTLTPVAPGAGENCVTEGAVLSGWIRDAASVSISLAESARS